MRNPFRLLRLRLRTKHDPLPESSHVCLFVAVGLADGRLLSGMV